MPSASRSLLAAGPDVCRLRDAIAALAAEFRAVLPPDTACGRSCRARQGPSGSAPHGSGQLTLPGMPGAGDHGGHVQVHRPAAAACPERALERHVQRVVVTRRVHAQRVGVHRLARCGRVVPNVGDLQERMRCATWPQGQEGRRPQVVPARRAAQSACRRCPPRRRGIRTACTSPWRCWRSPGRSTWRPPCRRRASQARRSVRRHSNDARRPGLRCWRTRRCWRRGAVAPEACRAQ